MPKPPRAAASEVLRHNLFIRGGLPSCIHQQGGAVCFGDAPPGTVHCQKWLGCTFTVGTQPQTQIDSAPVMCA